MSIPSDKITPNRLFSSLSNLQGLSLQAISFRRKLSLLLYSVVLLSVLIIGLYGYQHASHAYRSRATDLLDGYNSEVAIKIQDFLQMGRDDLLFLNNFYALRRYAYWRDIGDEKQMAYWQNITNDTLRNFTNAYDYVYKIRLLDNQGQEILGVHRQGVDGEVRVIPASDLRNQSQSLYFKETQKLQRTGQFYVSPINMNQEKGVVQRPLVPVVQFASPVISETNQRYGMIIYSVLVEKFFEFIEAANKNNQGRVFYLIDPQGQFLYHPDHDKMFGTVLGQTASFNQDFPDALPQMLKTHGQGIIKHRKQIISYRAIYPSLEKTDSYWLLVGVVQESDALVELNNFVSVFIVLFISVALLVVAANRYMLGQVIRPLRFVTLQLERLSQGVITQDETLFYPADDEIHQMLVSCERVVGNICSLTRQVDAIAKGDFEQSVELLSAEDRLGLAINNMTYMLRSARYDEQNRNWLNESLAQLNKALTGDLTSEQLADSSISILARALQAGRGVFYVYHISTQTLILLGSYMYTERNQVGGTFKLGEGAIGQVAREKKPILLTTFNLEQAPIVTGTSCSVPLYTCTYPLLHDEMLLGVIELASFSPFDALKQTLLQEATAIIASFLFVVRQREQIKNLLSVAEKSEKEAREKSVSLQKANMQMEEQQQQLQQQTEELQAANSQMEEQQQQLQQQTEELQQTNAQMEEAQQQLEQQNRRLTESQHELDARAKQLTQSSQYKSEFLANMSHELRTPLNSIILLSKMMAANNEKNLSADEVHHAEIIHNAGEELLRLINDVLDLSKIEAGRLDLHLCTIPSKDLLTELYGLFEHSAKEKNLSFKIADKLCSEFVSDRDRVSQIMRNLLSNALKFTKVGGITLSIERNPAAKLPLRISVKDSGIGIPEEKRKLIFEAFQQADGSISREYGGTGLGLSISLRFAQLLGGTIELHSVVGEGSEFALLLPDTVKESQPAPISLPETSVHCGENSHEIKIPHIIADIDLTGFKNLEGLDDRTELNQNDSVILLIDDDPLFGQALLEINRKQGYKTLLATTGKEGLVLAQYYHPNGILLDLGLPDMDGTTVLHEIKTHPDLSNIPVYIVSGREKDAALNQGGFLGYLQKPVDVEQISKAEQELLNFIHQASVQKVLVVENGSITAEQVQQMLGAQTISVLRTSVEDDFATLLSKHSCSLAIVDLNGQKVEQALAVAKKLRQLDKRLNFVFFGQQALTDEYEGLLHQYSDSIIIKTPQSEQRLLQNIERFLTKATQNTNNSNFNAQKEISGEKHLKGRHILVVDDDARNLFVITAALEKEGAKVSGALNGKRALEFLLKQPVDMVFMDIMMPEMDGYQTIAEIRKNPLLAKIPVVVLTAKALGADKDKALAAGADDYLAKPADYDVLIRTASIWCASK